MTSTANASAISLAERYAREQFGLSLPITSVELKSAFRKMAKELHTDTSGDKATNYKFIAMKAAYDFLVNLEGMKYVYGDREKEGQTVRLQTTDGIPLHELGLGVGPLKNGRDCERCERKGYTEEEDFSSFFTTYCYSCDSTGRVRGKASCHACKGTGKFTQERSKLVVDCRVCTGTGKHPYNTTYVDCPECKGRGRKEPPRKTRFVTCYECKGKGEIELTNPLFPKGAIIKKVIVKK